MVTDDEPLAREVLERYIADCAALELVASCADALAAGEYILSNPVDLLFLDINMPRLSGIRFAKTLTRPVMIIFTTAYPEFAAEGFETSAVDFLVKPFSFERFMKAVGKATEWAELKKMKEGPTGGGQAEMPDYILLRSDKKLFKVSYDDILCFEATGDYIKVVTRERTLIIHETFKNLVAQLPPQEFVRVHKSFIVPVKKIRLIEGNQVDVAGRMIPVGLVYKEELIRRLNAGRS
jgi:DNA-binding LytR/AlgR family response regulator